MNENGEPGSGRIERLEAAFEEFHVRLNRLEQRLGLAPNRAVPAPPPAQSRPPIAEPPPSPPPAFQLPIFAAAPPPKPPSAQPGEDAEFKFGSVVLPRAGAAVVLLGIAYLVGLGIAHGWITVWHQFYGAVALCAASIGIGFWKRREQFDFGQVLIGLGSCGLYLTFAGGHAFLDLYSGNALVLQFLILSLANLAYGGLSPSRTFLSIGLLGGMAASLMPMDEGNVALSLWLHGLILVPSVAIIARHKWRESAVAAWIVSTLSLLWPVFSRGTWPWQVGVLYGASLLCLLAYAWTHEDWEFDPSASFIPFAGLATAGLAFLAGENGGAPNSMHEGVFGALLLGASALIKNERAKGALALSGVLAPFVFAPLGLETLSNGWVYLGLSAISAALSFKIFPKPLAGLSVLGLGLGIAMYLRTFVENRWLSLAEESWFHVSAMAVIGLSAWSAAKWLKEHESLTFGVAVLASPLVSRLAAVLMGQPSIGASEEIALTTATMVLAAGGATIALIKRWPLMSFFCWSALIVSGFSYLAQVSQAPISFAAELAILLPMLGVVMLCSSAVGRSAKSADSAGIVASFAAWAVFSRLVYVIATQPSVGMSGSAAITLGWTVYAALLIASGFILDLKSVRLASLSVFGMTLAKVLMVDLSELDPGIRVVLLMLLGLAMIAGGYWYIRRMKPPAVQA